MINSWKSLTVWYIWHKKSLDASEIISTNEYLWKGQKKILLWWLLYLRLKSGFALLKRCSEMSQILFFETGNWSLADDITWLYFVDNEDLQHCRRSNCQEQVKKWCSSAQVRGPFGNVLWPTHSESLQEKLLPKIGFRYPPLCLVYIISTTKSLTTTALLGE